MRVLVTGGAGFIGSALVRYLVSEIGADVLNIDK
ncbi:NAD-dependent epimerase/dehydratase family protein, partial [Rhizobium leguminosarum]